MAKNPCEKYLIFVFDTETTGLANNAEIIEFGGLLLDGETLEEKDSIYSLIAPSSADVFDRQDTKKAFEMNHMQGREEELLGAPSFQEFCAEWIKMRAKYDKQWIPSGYNISGFDLPKLKYKFWQNRGNLPQYKLENFFHYHNLDAMPLYIRENWFAGMSAYVRLSDACKAYGVVNQKAHNALEDARATAELLRRMLFKTRDDKIKLEKLEKQMVECKE